MAAVIWGMLSEQRCKKYWCPVIKYNITFGIKSPKCLVSCFCRLILFAWGNKALFETYHAKIKIHAPLNSNSYCMFREKEKSIRKKITLFIPHLPGSLTWYCWTMLRAENIPWLSRPVRSMEAGGLCSRKACKQHSRPREEGAAQGKGEARAASLGCKRRDHGCCEAEGK